MLVLRSVAFNLLFYLNLVLHVIAAIPTFVLPRAAFMVVAKSWGHTSNALLAVAGITVEARQDPARRAARRPEASVGVGDIHAAHAV